MRRAILPYFREHRQARAVLPESKLPPKGFHCLRSSFIALSQATRLTMAPCWLFAKEGGQDWREALLGLLSITWGGRTGRLGSEQLRGSCFRHLRGGFVMPLPRGQEDTCVRFQKSELTAINC